MSVVTKNGTVLTDEQLERIAEQFEDGEWPEGETRIVRGRPQLFEEALKSVTYKDTASEIAAMDARAASLGLSRSEYLRALVRRDLAKIAKA
ncbi:toxin-antitoxin system antitoxin subunit [uncultured Slackia sp.]|uniref:toxin-antitoxin system antitoxin subunit n=1 Tax=uncultured Slackia sp. TaxID=665903 RepID=UPI0025E685C5|nr:toxin-antitoxin system antitoxin subunit [uncultured Slackia sp.]